MSEKSLDHANIGDFTRNPKTGEISKMKGGGHGQAWFPENWSKEDIREAGEYVTNMPEYKDIADGVTIFGDYNGVRIGIIKTNGEIGTIFPDNMLLP
ncbi:EndoU domain-containing protein [Bacillus wiedmannii]|uniref:EndoU domain-containing protein n=1 Tax=Bacillus wiedmannii TaxID=1890302 RepID=UPI0021001B16|nr:EndoU domain-containing protein [Bacillus wiedmannii]